MHCKKVGLSIVTCVYNGSEFVNSYFEKLKEILYLVERVIIVDDGSNDDTALKLNDNKIGLESKVKIETKKNTGLPDSRNVGLDLVDSDYVIFLDIDDYICPRGLERALEYLSFNNVDFIYGDVKYFSNEKSSCVNNVVSQLKKLKQPNFSNLKEKIFYNNYLVTPGACIFSVKKAKDIRFDPSLSLGEDWDFFSRLIPFSSGAYVSEYQVNYFVYSKSMSSTLFKDKNKVKLLKSKMVANFSNVSGENVNQYSQFLELNFEYFFLKKSLHSRSLFEVFNKLFHLYFSGSNNYGFKTINSIKLLLMRII
ncbi:MULTISPECIES: glycosyltransferase family 2 protein [Vibrio]|uniref:glycosyltransferase family 2 protein n=1 Tax=Vibrio TaxID=662 RepID=UPI00215C263F|nr:MULTISPECIES: glycosyltransferase family 2 protein [Vibrio]MCR9308423.1 glycosyltransferase family 2 protein [Vibrio diabolicus]MDU9594131.1 glycosyltransferase family 2 protein [Vibrio sp. 2-1-2a]MDU9603071.1 glycosyltransferase family 2 protein [Vibrio sp. 1-2-3a]